MGAGRKTETFQVSDWMLRSPSGSGSASARNLCKNSLGGVIFGCKSKTMGECLTKQLFGLPFLHFQYVRNIEPGLTLFLFNYSDRKMHGIYEATSPGDMNIDPYAWTNDGKGKTDFPAQVRIRIRKKCPPITENQFKEVIGDNYYRPQHFFFELDYAQTESLIALFLPSDISMSVMIPLAASCDANVFKTSTATKCDVIANFECVYSGAVEPKNTNEFPPLDCNDMCIDYGSTSTGTTSTTTLEKELREPCSYTPIEENAVVSESDTILHQERVSQALSEQQIRGETLEIGNVRGHVIEKSSVDPNCSTFHPKTCIDYPSQYGPRDINEGSMFPVNSFISDAKVNTTTSDLYNGNAELAQIVKELRDRSAALEKKQFESELEIQQLRNVVEDSGAQIQQLKCCVKELESKLMRSVGSKNVIYLIGGFNGESYSSALDSFSPSVDIMIPLKSMASVRSYASAAALNGNLYVFGGGDGSSWLNTVECYSQRNGNWTLCSPMFRQKGSLAGATLNGKIFALGGGNGSDCFADVEMYDPDIGMWVYNQSMLQKRFSPAAAELRDVLYATGGFDGQDYLHTAERLDPRVGYWTKVPNMKTRRGGHSMVAFNEKLYVIGGFDGESKRMISSVEIFDHRNDSWMEGEPLNLGRGYAAAAVLGGSLFIMGGIGDNNDFVETMECYSEGAGWAACTHEAVGKRCYFSAAVL